jgi:ATP-dependent RNA helicase DeaD
VSVAERESTVVKGGPQHVHFVLPHESSLYARVLEPALERLTADAPSPQLLIITPDSDTAVAIASAVRDDARAAGLRVVPVTNTARGTRMLRAHDAAVVIGSASTLVEIIRSSTLKLEALRALVLAWADELVAAGDSGALEAVMSELPKDIVRVIATDRETPEVGALIERYLRRARRVATDGTAPISVNVHYVETAAAARPALLRRVLDDFDAPSATIVVQTDAAEREVRTTLDLLGYGADDDVLRVARGAVAPNCSLVLLYELPPTSAALAPVAAATPTHVVAFVLPRQLPALRRMIGGAVAPLALAAAVTRARSRADRMRSAIRSELAGEFPAREILLLEPLLAEFDGIEIAAATMRLLDRERQRTDATPKPVPQPLPAMAVIVPSADVVAPVAAPVAPAATTAPTNAFTRVYMSIGERDNVRPADLVGAITGEAGITSSEIGHIELRESHSVIEIATPAVDAVVAKMNGANVRGRRVAARVDMQTPPLPRDRDGGSGRPAPRGAGSRDARGSRGPRSRDDRPRNDRAPRSFRSAGRDDRPREDRPREDRPREARPREARPRSDHGPRGPRAATSRDDRPRGPGGPPRGPRRTDDRAASPRTPRAQFERKEWTERAERVRHARRGRRDEA